MWPKYGKSSIDIRDCTVVTVRMSFITFWRCRQQAEAFHAELEKIGMDTDSFIAVLDNLINDSDQSDAFVHVSWF